MSENHYSRTTPRHQRRAASELSNANRIRGFRDAVKYSAKLRKNERTVQKYSSTIRSLALSLALLKSRKCQFTSISDIRHWASRATDQASPMRYPSCSPACARSFGCSAQHRAGRRRWSLIVCACRHSIANAPPSDGAGTRGCVSFGAGLLSRGGGEESSPARFRTKRKT